MPLNADQMTSADAARELGIGVRQVQRLVDAGDLTEAGRVGGSLLLDTASVHRLAQRGSQRGRPWSEETAWTAVDLLDHGKTDRLNAAQRSRLRARLRQMDAEELVRMARRRAEVHRFRSGKQVPTRLRALVTVTGESALDLDRRTAAEFDLGMLAGISSAGSIGGSLDGYVPRASLEQYRDEFFLEADPRGNVTLRTTSSVDAAGDLDAHRVARTMVVAIDLAESLDPRLRSAGHRKLTEGLRQV